VDKGFFSLKMDEFARTILLSPRLDEKLAFPEEPIDFSGKGVQPFDVPLFPGRPSSLKTAKGKRLSFPKEGDLKQNTARGIVLHFFANHELLAMELMALALLRFPNAPLPFLRGIIGTIKQEQDHMKLYMQRMEDYSVGFGDVPVNDFFWKAISGMDSPSDYIAGLSLTFEQANLDFALHYRHVFESLGDRVTSSVLKKVYEDEIGHIKHGVDWLDQFSEEGSQWEQWTSRLSLPLSPRRARGIGFDREGRLKAGLNEDFIDRVEMFEDGQGKATNIYYYNPDCELEVGQYNGHYTVASNHRDLIDDYGSLPMFACQHGDAVYLGKAPSITFLKKWHQFGVSIPRFFEWSSKPDFSEFASGNWSRISPWGWTSSTYTANQGLKLNPIPFDMSVIPEIFDKSNIVMLRSKLRNLAGDHELVGPIGIDGGLFYSKESVIDEIIRIHKEFSCPVVLKGSYGAAGAGMMRVNLGDLLTSSQEGWLDRILRKYGQILVEPWVERITDVSYVFDLDKNHARMGQMTRFYTSDRGQYVGHLIGSFDSEMTYEEKKFFHSDYQGKPLLELFRDAGDIVADYLTEKKWCGPIGIDAIVYKLPEDDKTYIKVLGEVNPRMTMGHLSLHLRQILHQGCIAKWRNISKGELKLLGIDSFTELNQLLEKKFPLCLVAGKNNSDVPKLSTGYMPTNDPEIASYSMGLIAAGDAINNYLDQKLGKI